MICLYTDFGLAGPYVGQLQAVLADAAPGVPVVNLMADAPSFSPRAAAYLLPALTPPLPDGAVLLCVVDPGVGTNRGGVVARFDGRWYVGPDNGLLTIAARRASQVQWWHITWIPEQLSATFHGRDWFAPVAGMLARGEGVPGEPIEAPAVTCPEWPDDLAEVIYLDHYGNAFTGLRGGQIDPAAELLVAGHRLHGCRTFADAKIGECFWFVNAHGLVEIAANRTSATQRLGLHPGIAVAWAD